jgi:hypothetical protein
MDLREIGIDGANWIRLAQDRCQLRAFVNTLMNLRFPQEIRLSFEKPNDYQLFKQYPAQWSK